MKKLWNVVRRWLIRNISVNGKDNFIQIGSMPPVERFGGWGGWEDYQ
ncbi:MAG: hypothetical protein LUG55_06305 [Clostridiales bacterium]|nr:hypothetical protein [Clostridiales bacterium]MCD8142292.1 hypothetical protein [Clostridiales bacterium]